MKKIISLLLILGLALTLLTGWGFRKKNVKKVSFSNLADSDVFCKFRKDELDKLVKKNKKIKMIYTDANFDINKQLDQVDNFIAQKVDVMILVPVDYEGIVPGIKRANKAGIPVICLGIESAGGDYTFVGSTNIDAGRMQGDFMKEKLPKNAKILYLQGTPGLYHSVERLQGFTEKCLEKRSDIKVLANLAGDYEREKGMKITEDWIQTFPQFDAIVAANDQMALGAIQALKGANRLKGVLISGVDGTPEACDAIKAGEMAQSVFQNSKGQAIKCYDTIVDMIDGKMAPKQVIVPFESITIENVDKYMK